MNQTPSLVLAFIETAEGAFLAGYSAHGLARLEFPRAEHARIKPSPLVGAAKQWHRQTVAALKRALKGQPLDALPPLDLSTGTKFQQQIWGAMRNIPVGQTLSYGGIARAAGKPGAARAAGGACGANPIPVLVPCHRVVAAGGKLGGFSSPMAWKVKLLDREGWSPA